MNVGLGPGSGIKLRPICNSGSAIMTGRNHSHYCDFAFLKRKQGACTVVDQFLADCGALFAVNHCCRI